MPKGIQKEIAHNHGCGYLYYGVCTCDEMDCAGEDCIHDKDISKCPVHNEDLT